ncbi:zinc ribbon domain-containing protein [Floridanema aerugineum]|uniref:Zinc ribbon domain-containing protein n=1 Tax=Floridaenema aerugineum BLCC-F46 TaxID=3153654 RepID=A0ABV4XHK5_9CYAN
MVAFFKNNSLNLSVREWVCPECKIHHDRDENATQNLREEGIRILLTNTVGHTEFQACGEAVRLSGACLHQRAGFGEARISRYSVA